MADLKSLRATIQRNCHIADARYGGNYSMCIYLLKMREYYRWEQGFSFGRPLPVAGVGEWLEQRERLWEGLQDAPFVPVAVAGRSFDPFATEEINEALVPHGLVYSAGLGEHCKPLFFLARLERVEEHSGYKVLISAREYARDLTAPPAMTQGRTIFVRKESLTRALWERIENWRWHQPDNAMGRALRFYDLDRDLKLALERMTADELDSVLLHEVGEVRAGKLLGEAWGTFLSELPRSRAEIMARAVRDHLADSLTTLPALVRGDEASAVHMYFANLSNMRKEMFPSLQVAYEQWHRDGDRALLDQVTQQGRAHWQHLAEQMLELHKTYGADCIRPVEDLVQGGYL